MTLPISDVFDAYRKALAPAFGDRGPDVTEENLQARVRGNYLMALSNKFGSMVLSTGNKSELAVGYCTLYGDMAGGLAVISDVPKQMVYELARWINREREVIPQATIDKPPSAELRPDQKDEDSLPPYPVLDCVLKAYIEDLLSPEEIAEKYGFELKLVRDIALLVDRNEYKRKQAAPGLKITSAGVWIWAAVSDRAAVCAVKTGTLTRSSQRHRVHREEPEGIEVKASLYWARAILRLALALGFIAGVATAQQSAAPAASGAASGGATQIQKTIEAYLRHLYAFGPDVEVRVSEPKDTPVTGLLVCDVKVKVEGNEETGKFYVSKDGKNLFRGELSDLTKDPLAENRAAMRTKNAPSLGDSKATITVVEYSDFECPVCRSLHDVMRGMLPNYPQVRLVFMDYPLEQIHPWARTAALAGRCAYEQNPQTFWKMYDLIYDNQDLIAAGNAYEKMTDYRRAGGAQR